MAKEALFETLFVGGALDGVIRYLPQSRFHMHWTEGKTFWPYSTERAGQLRLPQKLEIYTIHREALIKDHRLLMDFQVAYAEGWA